MIIEVRHFRPRSKRIFNSVAHRTTDDRRHTRQGGNECGRRPPIGTRAYALVRVSIVTQKSPTYRWPDKRGGGSVPLLVVVRFARLC